MSGCCRVAVLRYCGVKVERTTSTGSRNHSPNANSISVLVSQTTISLPYSYPTERWHDDTDAAAVASQYLKEPNDTPDDTPEGTSR